MYDVTPLNTNVKVNTAVRIHVFLLWFAQWVMCPYGYFNLQTFKKMNALQTCINYSYTYSVYIYVQSYYKAFAVTAGLKW